MVDAGTCCFDLPQHRKDLTIGPGHWNANCRCSEQLFPRYALDSRSFPLVLRK